MPTLEVRIAYWWAILGTSIVRIAYPSYINYFFTCFEPYTANTSDFFVSLDIYIPFVKFGTSLTRPKNEFLNVSSNCLPGGKCNYTGGIC